MKIEISNKHLSVFALAVLLMTGVGFLVSPMSPLAKESNLTCANRDGLTAVRFKDLDKDLIRIKELANPLSTYDWQNDGTAFIELMYVLNTQLGEFEPKIAQMILDLSRTAPCKNNNGYRVVTQKMLSSLEALDANLKTASGYNLLNFPLWAYNASKMLPHISKFESEYSEFLMPQ